MRYALRNKEKIKAHFGDVIFKDIIASLDYAFKKDQDKIRHVNRDNNGRNYFGISSVENTRTNYHFCILEERYDVYRLAFYKIEN